MCLFERKAVGFLGGQMEAELNLEAKQNSRGQVICQEAKFLKFGLEIAKVITLKDSILCYQLIF